ncbi:MAG TPA: VCBS domain-containing protein, partial [Sphingomicrobium sp.]|nr:VCBS domain-containing protein [Sphingomicrobium sp.]
MRYEDASHTGAFQGSEPDARNDADAVPAGAHTPATGNVITGEGTQTGPSGSDTAAGAHITSIAGAGGEDSSFAGGKLAVSGEFGRLSIDAEGNYSYQAKEGAPENSRDRFTYTLADNQGNADTAMLTIEIGKTPAVIKAGAQQVVVGPDGVVVLPAGVELSDIHIVGRNLVVDLPDGGQMVILDGAVFVPQLVLGGVEVPATNLAALLIGQEIAPGEGGPPQSSGGNFEVPVGPLDPGVPLGDLIPPTEYGYTPPEVKEVFDLIDEEPEIFFQPEDQAPSVAASDTVSELGLPERGDFEPAGTGEIGDGDGSNDSDHSEFTTGVIVYDSPDGVDSITISVGGNELVITGASVGDTINGQWGQLTITSVAPGAIGYEYRLADNTPGNDTHDDFLVTLVDNDGDVATATLTIDIIDDTPTARPDTDFIAAGDYGPVTGNVITDDDAGDHDVSGTDSDTDDGADTVGADDASLTSVTGAGATETTEGGWIVQGQYGVLTIGEDGSYSYTRNPGTPGGVNDVFNYTLTDGDGDVSSTTLTITIEDAHITVGENPDVLTDDDAVPLAGGNAGGPGDNVDADNLTGTLSGSGGDGPLTFDLQTTGAPDGFSYADGPDGSVLVQQVQNGVTVTVLTITLNASTGAYEVTQNAPILHDPTNPGAGEGEEGNFENNVEFNISYTVSDQDDDVETGTLTINVDDDTPEVTENQLGGIVDEDGLDGGNLGGVNDVPGADVTANGDVSELFSPGADQPLTFSLLTDTSSLRQDLTSNGVPVTYAVEGNTLTAMAGDTPVFTFVLNAETGEYTFTLLDQLDHPSLDGETGDDTENPTDQDLTIALGSIIQATDADGDSVTAPGNGLVITVDDDSPLPFEECPDDVIAVNDAGSSFTGDLNLPPVGADEPGTVSFLVD